MLTEEYRNLFARLGFPLSDQDGMPEDQISKAENRLGIRLASVLRDYYLVAGNEKVLNRCFNRLCSPDDWEIHSGNLIFMEENQTVVVWGVPVADQADNDPLVFQCPLVRGKLDRWYSEETRCSDFLKFMVHLQGAYGGGMPFHRSATAENDPSETLVSKWQFGGDVNGMRAYSMENKVVCVMASQGFGRKTFRIFGGATTEEGLAAIAKDLGITWNGSGICFR